MKRVTDIKKLERCEKLLWLSKKEPQPFLPFVYYNEDLDELAREKLQLHHYLVGERGDDNNAFFANLENYDAFCNMRFTYHDLRVKIPIMKKYKDGFRVYFTYASCFPKESDAQVLADQLWVLKQLNIKVYKVNTIHLNSEYVRKDDLDVNDLLIINDYFYNDKNHRGGKIKTLLKAKQRDVEPLLLQIEETLQKDEIVKERTNICTRKNKCAYFDTCFHTPSKNTSILHLVSSAYKFQLLEKGIDDLAMLSLDEIEGTRHQFAQIMAAKTNTLFFDKIAVKHFFQSQISYPISYLDFEWETYAYPPYERMKPFDVLTFQYSLHIEQSKDSPLLHKEYLGRHDCRQQFIEQLLQDIPKEGSVMCFNVEGAEKLRLKQLAKQFPQYEEQLRNIWERMIDLAIPFSNGLIYDNRMEGMYSLKKLVAIFTDYSYADLDISHGMEAVRNYRLLDEENAQQQEETRKELLAYCAMDTYAMVLIYHWILEQIQKQDLSSS
ncbi:MAG: DUF2779 domain-containing protein [Erysipelotrichia bacterium]|nr:DUF2779 domain-containing protein [Erysipelotrichia bacterium]